jgi:hypothetical protein
MLAKKFIFKKKLWGLFKTSTPLALPLTTSMPNYRMKAYYTIFVAQLKKTSPGIRPAGAACTTPQTRIPPPN